MTHGHGTRPRVCYEGDGGAGGSGGIGNFFSNLFGSGATQTAPTTTSLSLGELSPDQISGLAAQGGGGVSAPTGLDISAGGDPSVAIPLTGAVQPNTLTAPQAVPGVTPADSTALASQGGPGSGVGAIPAPGGGAASVAAPASIDPTEASRGITVGGQAPGFSDTVARNTGGLDPNVLKSSQGAGTGTSIDTAMADPSLRNILKAAGSNANILLPAAGLGYQALTATKAPEGLDAIRASAAQTGAQGQVMQKYLETGTLPPGLQAGLDQAREAAKASIRSRYANLPGQSSAMEQELANADQTAAAQGGQLAIQLFSQGMSESQVSNQLYEAILQQSLERDKELSGAVGNFATAMAGGGPSLKLSLG